MRTFLVATAIVTFLTSAAAARAGTKVKAELLCGVYLGGQITDLVPSPKKPRLQNPIGCALHLDGVGDDTYEANIHTVRATVDPSSGKRTKVTTSGHTDDVGATKDLEIVMQPSVADDNDEILFQPCEDFDVVASVFDDRGTHFSKTLHVAQACPKPRPLKATVACWGTTADGARIDLPDRQKASLDGVSITCMAESKDPRFDGTGVKFTAHTEYDAPNMNENSGHTVQPDRAGTYEEGEDESGFLINFDPDDIPACLGSFDVKLAIDDLTGAHLFGKTVTVKQACH